VLVGAEGLPGKRGFALDEIQILPAETKFIPGREDLLLGEQRFILGGKKALLGEKKLILGELESLPPRLRVHGGHFIFPTTQRERISWLPEGASKEFVLELAELFGAI